MNMAEQQSRRGALESKQVTPQGTPSQGAPSVAPQARPNVTPSAASRTPEILSGKTMWGAFCAFVLLSGPIGAQAAPVTPAAVPQFTPALAPLSAVSMRAARAVSSREVPLMPPVALPGTQRLAALPRPYTPRSKTQWAARPKTNAQRLASLPRTPKASAAKPGGPQIRVIRGKVAQQSLLHLVVDDGSAPTSVASNKTNDVVTMPAAHQMPPAIPPSLATPGNVKGGALNKAGMNKVIAVGALNLPPASQPLPDWMKGATVSIDAQAQKLPRLAANGTLRQPTQPVTNSDRLPNQIEVAVGTFVVLLTNTNLQTVAVADPNTADVSVVNARSILVNGKTPGVTSLVIVDGKKIRQYQVRVMPPPGTQPSDVEAAIGLPTVSVRQLRGTLILEGEVSTDDDAKRAAEIAGIYSDKVINQILVRPVIGDQIANAAQIQQAINIPGVSVRMVGDTAMLEGVVESGAVAQRAERIAGAMSPKVLNLLELPRLSVDQIRQSLGLPPLAPMAMPGMGGVPQQDGIANGTDGVQGGVAAPNVITPGTVKPPGTTVNGADVVQGAANDLAGPGGTVIPAQGIAGQFGATVPFSVRQVGDQIILEGTLPTQDEINRVLALAERSGLTVVNRLSLTPPPGADQVLLNTVASAIAIPGVTVRGSSKHLVLTGTVADTSIATAAEQIARGYAGEVDNLLQTSRPLLVDVDIRIMEITRGKIKNLGVTYPTLAGNAGLQDATDGVVAGLPIGSIGVGENNGGTDLGSRVGVRLRALEQDNNTRLLSNPHTTVLSGRRATFQVGGQVPIPAVSTVGANGTTSGIEFKNFGAIVDVVPVVSPNGAVTLRISTEVSQPDPSIGIVPAGGGGLIPGFTQRTSSTEVTMPSGGSLALSGLIQNNVIKSKYGIPFLSRIPVLGSLFTSKRFQKNETEMVIFVTPTVIANPLQPGTSAPAAIVAPYAGTTQQFGASAAAAIGAGGGGATGTGGGQ